ncbi:MAG: flagellar biosynthetic protein FliP, partial [Shewanella sp.]|nr:flagellar biosynthetic protein FliP [Shewanella sp.]
MKRLSYFLILSLLLISPGAFALDGVLPALTVTTTPDGGTQYSVTMQILLLMTAMSFLPAMIIMLT